MSNANSRKRRKLARAVNTQVINTRIESKLDLLLMHAKETDRRAAKVGAVSGGVAGAIAGGITGGAVAFAILYGKAVLTGA